MQMYPIQTRSYRYKFRGPKYDNPEGFWLEIYSSLLAIWVPVKYVGLDIPKTRDNG